MSPCGQVLQFALQVQYSVFAGLHSIVTQVFGLSAWVVLTGFAVTPPQARVVLYILLHEQALQSLVVLVRSLGIEHGRVTPLDSPAVVVVDAGEYLILAHAVARLSYIVEACVVHDRRRMSVFCHPCFVAQLLHRN